MLPYPKLLHEKLEKHCWPAKEYKKLMSKHKQGKGMEKDRNHKRIIRIGQNGSTQINTESAVEILCLAENKIRVALVN